MRIHILGGAGSGKSHIALEVSKQFHIPHYDLDDLFWDRTANEYGIKASASERDQALQAIVSQNDWVIEGVYISWVEPSFRLADKIFVLTPPLSIQEERFWQRHEDRMSGKIPSKKDSYESVVELVEWNKKYNSQSLPHFINNSEYRDKIVVLDSNTEVFKYLT